MAKKKVLVLIRRPPFGSEYASEALRMAVGLTLAANEITVALAGDGVGLLREAQPLAIDALEIEKHLEACRQLGVRVVAEREALQAGGVDPVGIEVVPRAEIFRLLGETEVAIPF